MKRLITISLLFLYCLPQKLYAQAPAVQWAKNYGGSMNEYANCVKQTGDGGFIVVGSTNSTGNDVAGFHGGATDLWVIKLSSTGVLQ